MERGVPLAQVRGLLGHASINTTERYDNQKLENLQLAAARLERGLTFDRDADRRSAPSNCQDFVKIEDMAESGTEWSGRDSCPFGESRDEPNAPEDVPSSHERAKRVEWLGGRDSNPDNLVQSQVSYR